VKRISFILFLISVSLYSIAAGYEIQFCAGTDSVGNCKGIGETFEWKGDRTSLQLIVTNKEKIPAAKLKLMLFEMKNDREGTLYADLSLRVIPNSTWAVKKLYFYKPGYYKVDVLDENNKYVTGGFVTITDRSE
jgi:hypothetical protein